MPEATNMADLEKMIQQQARTAMQDVQKKVLSDMNYEVGQFYLQGNPSLYVRTGNLRSSPRVTGITGGGNTFGFDAYLDTGYYLVPNPIFTSRGYASYFTPEEVFSAAESHAARILGKGGFWSRSLRDIKQDIVSIFSSYFN